MHYVKWCHPRLTVEVKHLAGSKILRHATVKRLRDLAVVASVGAALFTSRPSKVPFIENDIRLIEFAREKVA